MNRETPVNCTSAKKILKSGMNKRGKMVIVKCENCRKELFVKDSNIREKMFCTIRCMDSYAEEFPMK